MNLINNKKIKIPLSHYVGFQNSQLETPLGLITTEGNDPASVRRKAAVDRWSKKFWVVGGEPCLPSKILSNKPMNGFCLEQNIKHSFGWEKGERKWRIKDPRGFQLEITNHNLAQILSTCVIENGEILDKCIWGELGIHNVLIPISSDVYKDAIANTERFNKRVSPRSVKPGNTILTKNGIQGVFLGNYFPVSKGHKKEVLGFCGRKRAFVATIDPVSKQLTSVFMAATLEVSEIINDSIISKQECIKTITQLLQQQPTDSYVVTIGVVDRLSVHDKIVLNFIQRDVDYFKINHNVIKKVLVEHPDGRWGIASPYDLKDYNAARATIVDINKLQNESIVEYKYRFPRDHTSYLFSHSSFETEHFFFNLACDVDFKFYVIEAILLNSDNVELLRTYH